MYWVLLVLAFWFGVVAYAWLTTARSRGARSPLATELEREREAIESQRPS